MSVKISQLPSVLTLTDSAIVPIVQNAQTQSATISQLVALVGSGAKILINITATGPGNFTVPHNLAESPSAVIIQMTSGGQIWLQPTIQYDNTNLYLVSSGGSIGTPLTGTAVVFV